MNEIVIPTLLFWENQNSWYGSKGNARFLIRPATSRPHQDNPEEETRTALEVELWPGPLTKELSQVVATASFPLSEEGLARTTAWLEEQAAELNHLSAPDADESPYGLHSSTQLPGSN